jgi:hypothetical protein
LAAMAPVLLVVVLLEAKERAEGDLRVMALEE